MLEFGQGSWPEVRFCETYRHRMPTSSKAVSDQLRGHRGGGTDLSFVRVAENPLGIHRATSVYKAIIVTLARRELVAGVGFHAAQFAVFWLVSCGVTGASRMTEQASDSMTDQRIRYAPVETMRDGGAGRNTFYFPARCFRSSNQFSTTWI